MTTPSMKSTLLAAMLLSTGCGGQEETTAQSHTKAKKAKRGKKAKKAKKGKKGKRGKKAKRSASKAPTYSRATQCENPCLFLMDHSYKEVQDRLCEWCPGIEPGCELDWPSSDVLSCESYAELRNCIYAGHGYTFKKKKWNKHFRTKSWYKADPAFDASRLSPVEKRNVKTIKKEANVGTRVCP